MQPLPANSRWSRLERYARWKAGRFPLHRLPHDLLAHLTDAFLTPQDRLALLEALLGFAPSIYSKEHVEAVPRELRGPWLFHQAYCNVHLAVQSFADRAFLEARDYTRILAFADWSPFASRSPVRPIATFEWRSTCTPHGHMFVDEEALVHAVRVALRAARPGMHFAIHRELLWHGRRVIIPTPVLLTNYVFFPAFLAATPSATKASKGASVRGRARSGRSRSNAMLSSRSAWPLTWDLASA